MERATRAVEASGAAVYGRSRGQPETGSGVGTSPRGDTERGGSVSAQACERGSGWLTFAAIVMFSVAFFRIISAIAYFNNSNEVANLSAGLFGNSLWMWGIWDLAISALALFAGLSLLSNGGF